MKPRFKFLTGDVHWREYGGKFISQRLANGYDGPGAAIGEDYDFHYYYVMEICPNEDYERGGKRLHYYVTLGVVAPEVVPPDEMQRAYDSLGMYPEDLDRLKADPLFTVEALHGYGTYAVIWQESGNNLSRLMAEARKEARSCEMLFGFYMDRYVNRIGTTGWDAVSGDIWAGLRRYKEEEQEATDGP